MVLPTTTHLPHRHDDGEDDGAELRDGVVDEHLAGGRERRQKQTVEQERRILWCRQRAVG